MSSSILALAVLAASPRPYEGAQAVPADPNADTAEVGTRDGADTQPEPDPDLVLPDPQVAWPDAPEPDAETDDDGPTEKRVIVVTTNKLGGGTSEDAYQHSGGRDVVTSETWSERGATSVGEALERTPGVRSVEGIAGVGGSSTKLNLGVRGVNPRLSSRATVLLDETPLAMAPYGQPELSMFPISLFSIDRIDVVRGGASVRFGPQTAGGVFNLMSKPIPVVPQASIATGVDHFGRVNASVGYGTTVDKFGVWAEYAPQLGRSYRGNSDVEAHGGLIKMGYALRPRVDIFSTTHAYTEDSGLPGGLSQAAYDDDPFQSTRTSDRFFGWRVGQALKLSTRPRDDHALDINAYYNHSFRRTQIQDATDVGLVRLPRTYDSFGLEPRYTVALRHRSGPWHELSVGVRGAYELAKLEREAQLQFVPDLPWMPEQDDDARLGAGAVFVEDALYLLDDTLVLRAGLRGEAARISRRNNLLARVDPDGSVLSRSYYRLLPAASVWFEPLEGLATFVGYGRSFGPPTFVQAGVALNTAADLSAETTDTVEAGARLADFHGVWFDLTGWFRSLGSIRDVGLEGVDIMGDAYAAGVEAEGGWEPGEVTDALEGSEIYIGGSTTDSVIHRSLTVQGKELPWYPDLELWGGAAYSFPVACTFFDNVGTPAGCRGLKLGADVEWSSEQYSEFSNDPRLETPDGGTGVIPSYALLNVYTRFRTVFPKAWIFNVTIGVKNATDTRWFYRTDDRNEGILAQRPRTYYVKFDLTHFFFDAAEAANRRRARRRNRRRNGRGGSPASALEQSP